MAHNVTNYAEIQQNEIDVLKSIFMEDFEEEEVKSAAWNKKADRRFKLRLWPPSGKSDHSDHSDLFAVLSVGLPTAYPKQIPACNIIFGSSVASKIQDQTRSMVLEKTRALVGNEAIYEIAEFIQEQLDHALTVIAHTESLPALDEERVKRETQAAKEAETARQEQLRARREAQLKADEARSAAIGKEVDSQKSSQRNMSALDNTPVAPLPDVRNAVLFDTSMPVRAPSGTLITVRTVRVPTRLKDGPVTQVGLTTPADRPLDADVPTLLLKTCEIGRGWDENEVKLAINNTLEKDLRAVKNISGHRNVLSLIGWQIQATLGSSRSGIWSISILSEYIQRGSLRGAVETAEITGTLGIGIFRTFGYQILDGLEYLHRCEIWHGRLTLDNILLDKDPTTGIVVKISDISYQADIHFLKNPHGVGSSIAASSYWTPPEFVNTKLGKRTAAADIWDLGIVFLQMMFGVDVQNRYTAPLKIKDEVNLNSQLENLLDRIFKADPQRRPTCFDIRKHDFIRENLPALDDNESPLLSRVPSDSAHFTPRVPRTRLGSQDQDVKEQASRYAHDFTEIGKLGKGGFGQVYQAENKLDGQNYAIKKIISDSNRALEGVITEVRILGRLNHPYVVRYITSWTERTRIGQSPASIDSDSDSDFASSLTNRGSNLLSQSKPPRRHALDFVSNSGAGVDTDEDISSESDSGTDDEAGFDDSTEDHLGDIVFEDDSKGARTSSGTEDDAGVVFGDDSDNAHASKADRTSSPSQDRLPVKPRLQRARRRSSSLAEPLFKITLYIQMEFCEGRTLRHIIDNDISKSPEDYWRYLRQIAGALAYIHSSGIIHRDLKPENVFVSGDSIRLGDFGLAKPQVKERQKGNTTKHVGALTASIGTSFYIAPEVKSSGGGTYNEKADMYSLGVILFEMCYGPMATASERANMLTELRQDPPLLPNIFEDEGKQLEKSLICALLVREPADRIAAPELLAKLPAEANDEARILRLTAALSDETDPLYAWIVERVFGRRPNGKEAQNFTYDILQTQHFSIADEAFAMSLVKDQLIHVFRRHGAVESTRQSFVPATDYWTDPVKHVDESGQILHLPYDLTLPGARLLAKSSVAVAPCKSYSIGYVYRRGERAAQHPNTSIEIDFDIISKDSVDAPLRDAEAIKVMDEIIDSIPALSARDMCFHINHCDIIDTILRACKIPVNQIRQVKDIISKLGRSSFAQIRTELRGADIASTSADDLARYDFRDTVEAAIRRLKGHLDDSLKPAYTHLNALVKYAKKLRIKREIYFSPLSCHSAQFYTGSFMFQCLFDGRKRRSVICAGGRYDRLIQDHAINRSVFPCYAVGFQLSYEALAFTIQKHKNSKGVKYKEDGPADIRRMDVLVCSNDDDMLREEGPGVLAELWKNDIRAEPAYDVDDIDARTSSYGGESSHDWIIHIKQEGMIRVRSMLRNDEEEIPRVELISHLRSEMRERDRDRKTIDRTRMNTNSNDSGNDGIQQGPKVRVLYSQNKSKKSNRQVIVSDAQHHSTELLHTFKAGEIVAVELRDDLFEMLRGLQFDDNDAWKKAIQHADVNARHYMSQIQDELVDISREPQEHKNAFLYNFRSKTCMLFDLTTRLG